MAVSMTPSSWETPSLAETKSTAGPTEKRLEYRIGVKIWKGDKSMIRNMETLNTNSRESSVEAEGFYYLNQASKYWPGTCLSFFFFAKG